MIPEIPDVCPYHHQDGQPCQIVNDHNRERKTGPCFPLRIIRCKTHKIGFTIYPPGHFPWGRRIIAPVESDNSKIKNSPEEHRFTGTYFDAALDLNKGIVWPKESILNSLYSRYLTQTRHIKRAGLFLGVDAELDEKSREIISQILNVPGQLIFESASLSSDGYSTQSKAICNILSAVTEQTYLFERLSAAGQFIDLWPELSFWDVKCHRLRQPSFHQFRTRAAPD